MLMKKNQKNLCIILFIMYGIILCFILFGLNKGFWKEMPINEYFAYLTNFIPFKTIAYYIESIFSGNINLDICIKNLIGPILMFIPMGFLLPTLFAKLRNLVRFFITTTALIVVIEILQLLTRRGSLDVDDYILGMLGVGIGLLIFKLKDVQRLLIKFNII
ncbi:VanZ family protein [Turicibacter sanguinis]|nr:VanZ family protein [Turicibacter sanguinis]MTN51521.1 VanZ family protein [Turicibacter sanguinis]MTN54719.1 VanZ family protein [Turicibacter sanguinis]MTN57802.1 VanZ family protein [Turicibacter sanguinis]MTN60917.1 VanZ family protein [Turicibacter sanguinis]